MTTPYMPTPFVQMTPSTPTPATRGRGAKRGRKPPGTVLSSGPASHQANATPATGAQFTPVQWSSLPVPVAGPSTPVPISVVVPPPVSASRLVAALNVTTSDAAGEAGPSTMPPGAANL